MHYLQVISSDATRVMCYQNGNACQLTCAIDIINTIMNVPHFDSEFSRHTSSSSRTKSQNVNISRLVLQLSLPNPQKPGVKSRMTM